MSLRLEITLSRKTSLLIQKIQEFDEEMVATRDGGGEVIIKIYHPVNSN